MATPPAIKDDILEIVKKLNADAKVSQAMQLAFDETEFAMAEQVEITEIPAPTFEEKVRGEEILRRMKKYGLKDVTMDDIGNVIGFRPGTGNGPTLAIGCHMDTVFPAGTDVKVKIDGIRYTAPGIGDNSSALRLLFQMIRCFEKAGIQTQGDIYFVSTVGEEGLGDIRGARHFLKTHKVDGFIAVDNTEIGRVLKGAIGSRRYRITFTGPGGHSSAHFGLVPSAIHGMGLAIARMAKIKVPQGTRTTFTVGKISGGTSVNTIAPSCIVEIDMRSINNEHLAALENEVLHCFEEGLAEENAIWNIQDPDKLLKMTKEGIGDRPGGERPDDCPVIQSALAALNVLGKPVTNYGYSSTDANQAVSEGIPATCLSSGGCQYKTHSVKEYFDKIDIHLGPQLLILTSLALVGCAGTKPVLPIRDK